MCRDCNYCEPENWGEEADQAPIATAYEKLEHENWMLNFRLNELQASLESIKKKIAARCLCYNYDGPIPCVVCTTYESISEAIDSSLIKE